MAGNILNELHNFSIWRVIFGGLPTIYDAIVGLIVKMDAAGAHGTVKFEIDSSIHGYLVTEQFGRQLLANISAACVLFLDREGTISHRYCMGSDDFQQISLREA